MMETIPRRCKPCTAYRIIFVARGHAVTRQRRMLLDAQKHIIAPCANNNFIPLSVVWEAIQEACTGGLCSVAEVEAQLTKRGWKAEHAVTVIDKVAEKGYVARVGDRVSLT